MNIRHALEEAEKFLAKGKTAGETETVIMYAEKNLNDNDSDGTSNAPAICCFINNSKGIIHCGKSDEKPLFPGTPEERVELCRKCRSWCREKIKELRESTR